jgi:hypothetical protein
MPAPYLFDLPASVSRFGATVNRAWHVLLPQQLQSLGVIAMAGLSAGPGRREAGRRPTHRSYRSIALSTGFKLPQYLRSVSHKCRNWRLAIGGSLCK